MAVKTAVVSSSSLVTLSSCEQLGRILLTSIGCIINNLVKFQNPQPLEIFLDPLLGETLQGSYSTLKQKGWPGKPFM